MRKTSISIVGAGNLATHFALAFYQAGHTIFQVFSRNLVNAQALACRVQASAVSSLCSLNGDVDVVIIAVPDDSIASVVQALPHGNYLLVHTSGASSISLLNSVGRCCGVIWSPTTFVKDTPMEYSKLPFCLEASDEYARVLLCSLVESVSSNIFWLDYQQRQCLHLAAVLCNNFVNILNHNAVHLLEERGISPALLLPIAEQTLANLKDGATLTRQTGPAIRHDTKTIEAHRHLLVHNEALLRVYDSLTSLIQEQCK